MHAICNGSQIDWKTAATALGTGRSAEAVLLRWSQLCSERRAASDPMRNAPQSTLVGLSCMCFVACAAHHHAWGDPLSSALAFCQAPASFCADFVANIPGLLGLRLRATVCTFDRSWATMYALWITRLAVRAHGAAMVLTLLPLVGMLGYSRASTSRAMWVRRHCTWHLFAMAEGVLVMETVYRSRPDTSTLSSSAALGLLAGPVACGLLSGAHGLRQAWLPNRVH